MSTQHRIPAIPRALGPSLPARIRRAVTIGGLLAALTATSWLLICPWDWTPATGEESEVYSSAVHAWQWGVIGIVLLALGAVSGAFGYRLASLFSVATPAFLLFCYQSATARIAGGSPWVVAAIGVMPVLYVSIAVMALLGKLARHHYAGRYRLPRRLQRRPDEPVDYMR